MSVRLKAATVGVVLLLLFSAVGVALSYEQVNEGHVGVEKKWGSVTGEIHDPGPNWIVPIQDGVQHVEIRPRTYTMSASGGEGDRAERDDSIEVLTNDGVSVDVDVTVRYRVKADNANQFVKEYSTVTQAEERLIRPSVRSRLRTEGGDIDTSEIYTKEGQQKLRQAAREVLINEFEGSGLTLETVQIRRIHLPDGYAQAVEDKEVAKQEVQQKEHEVESAKRDKQKQIIEAEADAEEQIIKAEAEAESNRIVAESLSDEVLTNRYIESLDESDTVYVPVDGQSGLPTYLEVQKDGGNESDGS